MTKIRNKQRMIRNDNKTMKIITNNDKNKKWQRMIRSENQQWKHNNKQWQKYEIMTKSDKTW